MFCKKRSILRAGKAGVALCAALMGLLLGSSLAQAAGEWKPTKPITFIVPFPPAGINDVLARMLAERLGKILGQPVIVENRPGASGNIGADALAKAIPDGHTVGILNSIHAVNAAYYRKLPYSLSNDLVPVAPLGESPLVLVANPHAPYKTVAELLAYARSNPGKINYGGPTGYPLEMIKSMSNVDITNIPYKGSGATINDIIAGHIDLATGPLLEYIPHVKAGKLKLLAVGTARRLKEMPDVPTVAESIPGYDVTVWYGMFVPKGTPREAVARLRAETKAILNDPAVRRHLAELSVDASFSQDGADALASRVRAETDKSLAIVSRTGGYIN
ncbi:hypothetical protein UB46_19770 [Burkholderiaceae bacterium 16]|nr:hypothetical protein UB46_19770 [Burkholderiaceae bacterium 16]